MKDRKPKYPGRVRLTPVQGQENVFDLERADEPLEDGTPLNKLTLLTDETAKKFFGNLSEEELASVNINGVLGNISDKIKEILGKNIGFKYIEIGSYIGTGTVGYDNPTEIILNHDNIMPPLFVLLWEDFGTKSDSVDTYFGLPSFIPTRCEGEGNKFVSLNLSNNISRTLARLNVLKREQTNGEFYKYTISFGVYSANHATHQYNSSNKKYNYMAFYT